MHVLTNPAAINTLPLSASALQALRQQLAIPGYNPQELQSLWQELPAGLIYFAADDLPLALLLALLAQLPLPEYEVSLNEVLRLRLHLFSDDGAGLYIVYPLPQEEEHEQEAK